MRVLDTNMVYAVRCSNCGKIDFHSVSLFQLPLNNAMDLRCECKNREAQISVKNNDIILKIPCLACDILHTYKFRIKDILKKRITVVCCQETGLELCFLGNSNEVNYMVSKYQEDLDNLMGELGLFENL